MAGVGTTYTASAGLTPQGQAVASNMPNATNTTPPPNPLASNMASYPSDQQLNSQYAGATQNLAAIDSPVNRQALIANSNLPTMQTNYEDLSRQLFEYDKGVLSPKFGGNLNPNLPPDAASFGRVDASPLAMTVGSSQMPTLQALGGANPTHAYAGQISQANSLADLIGSLVESQRGELGARIGSFTTQRQGALDTLNAILGIMNNKKDLATTQASLQNQRDIEMMKLGYVDSNGDAISGVGDLSQFKTKFEKAKYLRDLYNAETTIGGRKRISDTAKQLGVALTPKPLTPAEITSVGADVDVINRIQDILDVMNKNKLPSGLPAEGNVLLSKIGFGDPEVNKALGDLQTLRIEQEKYLGGVRAAASPQMYQKLAGATVGPTKSIATNKEYLQNLLTVARNHLQLTANQHQYVDTQDLAQDNGINIPSFTSTTSSNSNDTKVINGSTYKKVSGGWQKVK